MPNYKFLLDAFRNNKDSLKKEFEWKLSCNDFNFKDTNIGYSYFQKKGIHLLNFDKIHLKVKDLILNKDSISFKINQLSLNNENSFKIKNLSTYFLSYQHVIQLSHLKINTEHSSIEDVNLRLTQTGMEKEYDSSKTGIDLSMKNSIVNFIDISHFIPSLKGMDMDLSLSGRLYGTIADLKGKDLSIGLGNNTKVNCECFLNGLPDIKNTYISLKFKDSYIDLKDISNINLPENSQLKNIKIPAFLNNEGLISYNGNFTGFLSNFVGYGNLKSKSGNLNIDLSFIPLKKDAITINGHLKTVNFNLGKLFNSSKIGNITFSGNINGNYDQKNEIINGKIAGKTDSILINNYCYKNILLDGKLEHKKFDGFLKIDDKNLKAKFNGELDFNSDTTLYNFYLLADKANLVALNIDKKYKKSDLSFDLKAKFRRNSPSYFNGYLYFEKGKYSNENDSILFKNFTLNIRDDSLKNIRINSDYIDANIDGNFSISECTNKFKNLIHFYLPDSPIKQKDTENIDNYNFNLDIKDLQSITNTFFPDISIGAAKFTGNFNEKKNSINLEGNIPDLIYKNSVFNNVNISVNTNKKLILKLNANKLKVKEDDQNFYLSFVSSLSDNHLNSSLIWNNNDKVSYKGELGATTIFTSDSLGLSHIETKILPENIYIADTLWNIHKSTVIIDSSRIEINNAIISHKKQSFALNGVTSKDKSDHITLYLNNFNLNNLKYFYPEGHNFKGSIKGTAGIFDLYEKPLFLTDLNISELYYNEYKIGNISISSKWDNPSSSLQSEVIINKNKIQTFRGYGSYYINNDSIDTFITANNLSINFLNPLLKNIFDDVQGFATGNVKIYGKTDKIYMNGSLFANNAKLKYKVLQLQYGFSDSIKFRKDSIIFDHITISDQEGNKGVFNGSLRHDNFKNIDYDMSITSPRILAMNTTADDNSDFYGKLYTNPVFSITGKDKNLNINCSGKTLSGTSIYITLNSKDQAQQYDFLSFVDFNKKKTNKNKLQIKPKEKNEDSKLNMAFNVEVTPDAKIQVEYNSLAGDVIRTQGSGNLLIKIDPKFNISLFGKYTVEHGNYLFTLKNVINKKFEIKQGGTINWNGNPYNAIIDLNAIYKLKASVSDLFANSSENIDYNKRISVECKILLTENLSNPTIKFGIDFPFTEDRIKDEIQQYFNTQEDLNKQILSLLVMGKFYTPEYLRGTYESSNSSVVGNTASELFSNQLSNWLSKINEDIDIGVDYRPRDETTDNEIELALSTQIFNDRVTLNGNIGNNGSQTITSNNSSNIVGDFDLKVKLTNNGKLQFEAYNQSNNNIIYDTSPYTQGIGISYHENYNTFHELWMKIKKLFVKKQKK
ncbi:MAG: translocation/assembly module TamB domain-containing protein [Prolixibacteraceae bacterium]|nr:translocation/assembly module TamB domain-containing protein [Prolixibacteraceae bacterium]